MRNGLVTVEGDQWQKLRRLLAPMFARKTMAQFAPAMTRAAAAVVERWQRQPDGSVVELKTEMSRVALEVLLACIFADGLGDPEAVCAATVRYYATCGGLDPFDVIGLPDFVPRLTRLGTGSVLRDFDQALSAAIAERRRSLAAKDPETGERMTEAEARDNVMTLIFAGQETTSSALTWRSTCSRSRGIGVNVSPRKRGARSTIPAKAQSKRWCKLARSSRRRSASIGRSSASPAPRCGAPSLPDGRSSAAPW